MHIERENMKMLRKMHEILRQTSSELTGGGPSSPKLRSLNSDSRRAELTRIMESNLVRNGYGSLTVARFDGTPRI